jgi:hypothetical protein
MPRPGGTTQRGYGPEHRKLRAETQRTVDNGEATCWRCGHPITPEQPWDLGHNDNDRTRYAGPEHQHCNRSAGATQGNTKPPTPPTRPYTTTWW